MSIGTRSPRTGGTLIVSALARHGIDTVYCVPGESHLAILDALLEAPSMRVVTCRHEHGAAMMAEAHGKLTGRPAVCLVTRGPGACNASIGVHTAFQDSTPMLLLIGQVERAFLGREAFQEVALADMFAPLAKRAVQVGSAGKIPEAMAGAIRDALSDRPGPVVLALPEDVLGERAAVAEVDPYAIPVGEPDEGLVERFHHLLGDARRPIVIVGGGGWTAQARDDLAAFLLASGLPVCCAFRRHDIVDNRDPLFVGALGIGANPALIARVKAADLVIAIGTRLGEMTTQGYTLLAPGGAERDRRDRAGPDLVHVYPDAAEPGRVFPAALAIAASQASFVAAARRLAPANAERWRNWAAEARREYIADRALAVRGGALDLGKVMAVLDALLPADAVISVDAGNFSGWPQRFLTFGSGRRLLGPCNGAMGYAVPAAIAAKCAGPERTVVACVGDGGFGMTGQELATAMAENAAIIVLVFDNGMYGTIRMHQERAYPGRTTATTLTNPDFAALARAYGAHGEMVTRTEAFRPAWERAVAGARPAVIALKVDPEVITTRQTLSAIRGREPSPAPAV